MNCNSLEYALLSWLIYLQDKTSLWCRITKTPNIISAHTFENDFQNMLCCNDSSEKFKQVGLFLMKSGKTHLKQPDKFGSLYVYNVDVMIDKVKRIQRNALELGE